MGTGIVTVNFAVALARSFLHSSSPEPSHLPGTVIDHTEELLYQSFFEFCNKQSTPHIVLTFRLAGNDAFQVCKHEAQTKRWQSAHDFLGRAIATLKLGRVYKEQGATSVAPFPFSPSRTAP